jgi:hypothetical protein
LFLSIFSLFIYSFFSSPPNLNNQPSQGREESS